MPEHFTGRVAELGRLTAIARDVGAHAGTMVICTIDGMAGTGKSALAAHWGNLFADRFPDGQLYVDLHGFGPPGIALSAAAAVRALLGAMAIPQDRIPVGLSALCAPYRSVLADRRMLIVLDNARDAAQVRPLLPGSAGCLVLITSRNRLLSLTALEGARSLTVDPLSPGEARDLLARRLGAGRLAAEPQAAAVLIELCTRLPLALNIAAARAGTDPGLPLTTLTLAGLGAYREAYSHFGLALGLVRRGADRVGEADTHLGIALTLGRQDRHRQALKHITQALALARDQGDRVVQARALNAINDRHCRLGEYQQALANTRRALDLLHEADSRTGEAAAWFNRGMAFHHLGQYRESLICYGRALNLFHQAHDRHAQAETLIRIGDTHYLLGSEHAARDAWQQALTTLEEIRHPDADQLRRKLHHGPPGLSPTTRSA